jgi:hypothetical protein
MFTQKKGPSDEEVIEQIKKEEGKRKITRTLNRLLREDPNENPLALEFSLKNGATLPHHNDNASHDDDWELVEEDGVASYYWNRRTNVSTYDNPFESSTSQSSSHPPPPPPPPPPRQLVGLGEKKEIYWVKVTPPDGSQIYYWNKQTEEATLDEPEEYLEIDEETTTPTVPPDENETEGDINEYQEEIDTENSLVDALSDAVDVGEGSRAVRGDVAVDEIQPHEMGKTWEEVIDSDSGEISYVYQTDEGEIITRIDRPDGVVYIVVPPFTDEDGIEHERQSWEEVTSLEIDEMGNDLDIVYYKNLTSGDVVTERPLGQVIIVEGLEGY